MRQKKQSLLLDEQTTSQAAKFLNVSEHYLRWLLDSGMIAYRQVGEERMMATESLLEFAQELQRVQVGLAEVAQLSEEGGGYDSCYSSEQ